jgi:hypothetical protein
MYKAITVIACLVKSFWSYGQTLDKAVVSTAGNIVSNSSISLEYTIGESAVGTDTNPNLQLSQGFNQGYKKDNSSVSGVEDASKVRIYPNPTSSVLHIQAVSSCQIRVISVVGEVITNSKQVSSNQVEDINVEITDGTTVSFTKWIKTNE